MITKDEIKHIRSLQQKKYRQFYAEFLAEGPKLIEELLQSGMQLVKLYSTVPENFAYIDADKITQINSKQLSQISQLKTPNQALALFEIKEDSFDIRIAEKEWVLFLDDINDPGNLGTIIRTADWFGISHIICSTNTVDIYNPKVIQSTMGSIARVNVSYADIPRLLEKRENKDDIYGSFMDGEDIRGMELPDHGILIIGSEAHGISEETAKHISKRISIKAAPEKEGKVESLNAAIATAILCFEIKNPKD